MYQDLWCGAGQANITLPVGTPMGGFANRMLPCQGVLDALSARAVLLQQGSTCCLLVTLDALAISAAHAQALAQAAIKVFDDDSVHIRLQVHITCSHTHSGADLAGMFGAGAAMTAYAEQVTRAVCAAVRQAAAGLAQVQVRRGTSELPIGRNRRLRPGHAQVTPREREQGAEIDSTLTAVTLEHAETAQPVAVLFHTACHPVCLGPENVLASGDFAGLAAQYIEQRSGAVALFLNGAAGNVTPLIGRGSSYAATRALGQQVGQAVLAHMSAPLVAPTLAATALTNVALPLSCHFMHAEDIAQHAAWLRQQDTGFIGWGEAVERWQACMLRLLEAGGLPDSVSIPLGALQLGGVRFVFIGAEVFNEYQRWQPAGVRLVGYANGEGCYVPTAAALDGGGYEVNSAPVFYGLSCAPGPRAEGALLTAIAEQIDRLENTSGVC
jgi:hypothetical protein